MYTFSSMLQTKSNGNRITDIVNPHTAKHDYSRLEQINPLNPHDASKHHFPSLEINSIS